MVIVSCDTVCCMVVQDGCWVVTSLQCRPCVPGQRRLCISGGGGLVRPAEVLGGEADDFWPDLGKMPPAEEQVEAVANNLYTTTCLAVAFLAPLRE